jgi:hypothetical protein
LATDSAVTYVESIQKRAKRIAFMLGVLLIAASIPLIVSSDLRLDLAYRFDLVAGPGVEKIAEADSGKVLVVIPFQATSYGSRQETRYEAAYIAERGGSGHIFTNLTTNAAFDVPVPTLDFLAADDSGRYLLVVSGSGTAAARYLIDVDANTISALPEGQTEPSIPGDWSRSIWSTRIGRSCSGISPVQHYLFCFRSPVLAKYLAGDFQIDVQRYGQYADQREIFRGAGTQPVAGFTADDAWLYFQNERGIWREPMSPDMFDA